MKHHNGGILAMAKETVQVLFVEDNPQDVEIVRRMLRKYERAKFEVTSAGSTKEGEEALNEKRFDLILLDYKLPGEDGLSFLRRIRDSADLPPIIMLTARGDERVAVNAMRCGAYDYFPKSSITSEVLGRAIHQALEKYRLADQLDGTEQVVFRLAAIAEARDFSTRGHLHRMAKYALRLGQALRLDEHQLVLLRYGAILHDIGKIAVNEDVLRKPGPLTKVEWAEMCLHPIIGEKICSSLRQAHEVGPIIRHHHERWDGEGYLDRLAGEEIPFLARVVSIIDAFDAMLSDRPYRKALPLDETIRRLSDGAGAQWDPNITQEFLDLVRYEGLGLENTPDLAAAGAPRRA
jgi:putative two-component system response regulator